jgi:hypothetical protein
LDFTSCHHREAAEGETSEELEAEQQAGQEFIDNGKLTFETNVHWLHMLALARPLAEEGLGQEGKLISKGFPEWSCLDFQQFVRGLET